MLDNKIVDLIPSRLLRKFMRTQTKLGNCIDKALIALESNAEM